MNDVLPHVRERRKRRERLEQAASEARASLSERHEVLDDVETITAYAAEMPEFLGTSELTESKAFPHSFVKEIAAAPSSYTIPMPGDRPCGALRPRRSSLARRYCLPSSLAEFGGPDVKVGSTTFELAVAG